MIHTKFIPLMLAGMLVQAGISDIATNQHLRRHFNHVSVVHVEGIGYALAQHALYPDVDPTKGLARFWHEIALSGNIDALFDDADARALAEELHAIVKNTQAFVDATAHLVRLRESNADAQVVDEARFHVHAAYVQGLVEEANRRGCPIRRPDSAPKLSELQPGQGGTFAVTDAKNWGNLAYVAALLQTNADLDVVTHDCLLKAFALAQLIYRSEQA